MSVRLFDPKAPSFFRDTTIEEICRSPQREALWVDVIDASPREIGAIGEHFGFHALALEDVRKRRQRPKVDVYDDHLFVVLYALDPPDHAEQPSIHELAIFLTQHAVVTMHLHPIDDLDVAARRWAEHRAGERRRDASMLAYTIADTIVDGYFPVMDVIADRIDDLEELMFQNGGEDVVQQVFAVKRGLLEIRRVVAPTRDVFNAFTRRELPLLGDQSFAYFQDVYDHVIRVTDTIDADRDILSSVIDVYLSLVSNRLNQTVRTLTSASIILMSLALVAGIYGMNFENMPELRWEYGYFTVLGVMIVIAGLLALVFKRARWW